jgi:ABC-type transporter Mla maintaining outer membrane lipid asymmetry ATPase subunit MlaF
MSAAPSPPRPPTGGIVLRNVSFRFPGVTVLANASLDVPMGSTAIITGANGSGKSTLLYLCAGLISPDSGSIAIAGRRPDPHLESDLVRRGVHRGFVFQEGGLLSNMSALANVALPLRYHADVLGLSIADVERQAKNALTRLRVNEDDWYALPAHLSFGVRRRVAFARAVGIKPNFFFFDDPDVGVDPRTSRLLQRLLVEFRDDPSITTLIATNRDDLVDELGVPGYVLTGGRLIRREDAAPPTSLPPSSGLA